MKNLIARALALLMGLFLLYVVLAQAYTIMVANDYNPTYNMFYTALTFVAIGIPSLLYAINGKLLFSGQPPLDLEEAEENPYVKEKEPVVNTVDKRV
jgi:hypothetical protein